MLTCVTLQGAIQTIPSALIWHLGFYRDEKSLQPVAYYNKLENYIDQVRDPKMTAIVVDPMLATGGTLAASIQTLKDAGSQNIIVRLRHGCQRAVHAKSSMLTPFLRLSPSLVRLRAWPP